MPLSYILKLTFTIRRIIILSCKDNDEISKDLFDEVNKVVIQIFITVAFNIVIEEVEDKLTDLVINFIKELKEDIENKFLSAGLIAELNFKNEQEIYKDQYLDRITYKIYIYLRKSVINIIKNQRKKRTKEIPLSFLKEKIIISETKENNYKERLRELIENLDYISLTNKDKQFIYLMYNNGDVLTVKEIALILKISIQAVYKRINRITKHYQEINQ